MAEIHIQKKKRSVWPWLLGILLVAAVILYILFTLEGTREIDIDVPFSSDTTGENLNDSLSAAIKYEAVNEYITFVRDSSSIIDKGNAKEFTSNGLRLINSALSSVLQEDSAANKNIVNQNDSLRKYAEELMKKSNDGKQGVIVKKSFITVSDIFNSIYMKKNSVDNRINNLEEIAQSIRNKELNDQKDVIKRFFEKSGEILQSFINK
jgi:hypothetical protein